MQSTSGLFLYQLKLETQMKKCMNTFYIKFLVKVMIKENHKRFYASKKKSRKNHKLAKQLL